jgi:hypothetical protein
VRLFSLITLAFVFLFSCKKEKEPLLLFLSPTTISYVANPNDIIRIELTGSSGNQLTQFKINQRKISSLTTNLLDSVISGQNFSFIFEYSAPIVDETSQYLLEFSLYDDSGDKKTFSVSVQVIPDNLMLTETTGNEMFSHASSGFDAFNLATGLPLHSETADSSIINIMDVTNDTINPTTLLRKWESPAGNKFVRYNDFDYANASFSFLKNSYDAGMKNTFVENIASGDIILTKIGNPFVDTGYVAIKVIYVIDDDSTQLDRYIFNFKK